MKVTICGPNLRDQSKGELHVHAAGCADLVRGAAREPEYRNGWTIEAQSRREIVEAIYPPGDFGYDPEEELEVYEGSVHFFPCCDALAETTRTELLERLELAGLDIEPERCDTAALRATAADLVALAELLEAVTA